jgi:drug/metabolite transporter (DMT)-like permease
VFLRVTLAAIALQVTLVAFGIRLPREARVWSALLVMSFINNIIPFSLIAWAQSHIAGGLASILNATTPLFGVVVAHYATSDEKLTGQRLAGVAVGFLGVVIMMGPTALQSLGADVLAQIAVLAASVAYALSGVYGRRFNRLGVAPLATAAGMLTISSVLLLPVMLLVDRPWTMAAPSTAAIASIVGLSLVSTAFAYLMYFRILAAAGATNILLVTFLIPVTAIILGATLLDERLEPKHFWGMALIGAGLGAIDGRPFAALARLARA